MPVTFSPAKIPAEPVKFKASSTSLTPLEHLQKAHQFQALQVKEMLQSSLSTKNEFHPIIIASKNGFVHTLIKAYSDHHALIIRPDDVWTSILTQFSFFVGGRAEGMRAIFVDREDKLELEVIIPSGNRYTVDLSFVSQTFTDLIHENIKDDSAREWMIPNFSTTTPQDEAIASMVLMATMKEYFEFSVSTRCGLPRVTLEGEKSDWELLLSKIEKLKQYGMEAIAWYHLLVPVLSRFVRAFDAPDSKENSDFWQTVAHHQVAGSGLPNYWAGWIGAFCVFDSAKGKWLGPPLRPPSAEELELVANMTPQEFWSTFTKHPDSGSDDTEESDPGPYVNRHSQSAKLTLDGISYHHVSHVPSGFVEVPVKVDDNGYKFEGCFIAGQMGSRVISSNDKTLSDTGKEDTLAPASAWWFFEKRTKQQQEGDYRKLRTGRRLS